MVTVLPSGKVNHRTGDEGRTVEVGLARAGGGAHAIAFADPTVALERTLHVPGIGPGDEVIVTPRRLIGSASAVAQHAPSRYSPTSIGKDAGLVAPDGER